MFDSSLGLNDASQICWLLREAGDNQPQETQGMSNKGSYESPEKETTPWTYPRAHIGKNWFSKSNMETSDSHDGVCAGPLSIATTQVCTQLDHASLGLWENPRVWAALHKAVPVVLNNNHVTLQE